MSLRTTIMRCTRVLPLTLQKCLWSTNEVIFLGNWTIDRVWTATHKFYWLLNLRDCKGIKKGQVQICRVYSEETGFKITQRSTTIQKLCSWFYDSCNRQVLLHYVRHHLTCWFTCIFRESHNVLYFLTFVMWKFSSFVSNMGLRTSIQIFILFWIV